MTHRLALTLACLICTCHSLARAADPRTLFRGDKMVAVGGAFPTAFKVPLTVSAGETLTIAITLADDDSGDGGLTWRLEAANGQVLSKAFCKEKKRVSWNVAIKASGGVVLILEDNDTNTSRDPKKRGNGFFLNVNASGNKPAAKPAPGKFDNYFGGPKAWYDSGKQLGQADRKAGKRPDANRYQDHFDNVTRGEFLRGYGDAFR